MHIPPLSHRLPAADPMRQAAVKLETAFIAEMLRTVGFGMANHAASAGAGGDAFSSFLIAAQAEHIAERGGIGLAESLFRAMTAGGDDAR